MIKLVGLLILPSLIFSPIESDKTTSNVQISAPEQYAIVSEKLFDCYENAILSFSMLSTFMRTLSPIR